MSEINAHAGPSTAEREPTTDLAGLLDDVVRERPNAPALLIGADHVPVTYRDLAAMVDSVAGRLTGGGLRPGDPVALAAGNTAEFVVGLLASAQIRLVVAPIDPALPAGERAARLDRIGARIVLTGPRVGTMATAAPAHCPQWAMEVRGGEHAPTVGLDSVAEPRVKAPPPGLSARDALIMFTTGTTTEPKMVPWTHANVVASVHGVRSVYRLGPSDATVAVMPFFHGHGLIAGLLSPLAGGACVLLPERGRFAAHTFWEDMRAVRATWFTAVPTIHEILLDRAPTEYPGPDLVPLRFVRSCSAALNPATARALERTFAAPVLCAYGMTETTHQATSERIPASGPRPPVSVGVPCGVDIRIVADGRDCRTGEVGEVWVRGRTVVRGYLDDPAQTARSFTDGWYHSGDLGALDDAGNLMITGRIKDLINRGGEKISPEHVEDVLGGCPGVAEAAVFGVPDPKYGEGIAALVVPRQGQSIDRDQTLAYCAARLASFEVPDHLAVVAALPHTPKGALDRRALPAMSGVLPAAGRKREELVERQTGAHRHERARDR